jgi:hypothetical protein
MCGRVTRAESVFALGFSVYGAALPADNWWLVLSSNGTSRFEIYLISFRG